MKTQSALLAILALLACRCSTTEFVERSEAPTWAPKALDHLAEGTVEVLQADGERIEGELVMLDSEKVILAGEQGTGQVSVPLDNVLKISGSSDNAAAVIGGVLGGALLGGAIGAAVTGNETTSSNNFEYAFGRAMEKTVGMGVGVLAGAAVGGLVVAGATAPHRYAINHTVVYRRPPLKTVSPVRPDAK